MSLAQMLLEPGLSMHGLLKSCSPSRKGILVSFHFYK